MTSVNVTAVTNTVTVTEGDTTVVTVATAGPQGPVSPVLISQQVIAEDYAITAGYNGLSVEDVSVAATYTVTVPAGATWVIVF